MRVRANSAGIKNIKVRVDNKRNLALMDEVSAFLEGDVVRQAVVGRFPLVVDGQLGSGDS